PGAQGGGGDAQVARGLAHRIRRLFPWILFAHNSPRHFLDDATIVVRRKSAEKIVPESTWRAQGAGRCVGAVSAYHSAMPTDAGRLWTPDELLGPLNAEEARYVPKQLFASGHTEWLQRSPRVAIVGARKASNESLRRAARLVRFLVKHDATII